MGLFKEPFPRIIRGPGDVLSGEGSIYKWGILYVYGVGRLIAKATIGKLLHPRSSEKREHVMYVSTLQSSPTADLVIGSPLIRR